MCTAPLHSMVTEASSVLHRNALSSSPPLQARAPSGCRLTQNTEPSDKGKIQPDPQFHIAPVCPLNTAAASFLVTISSSSSSSSSNPMPSISSCKSAKHSNIYELRSAAGIMNRPLAVFLHLRHLFPRRPLRKLPHCPEIHPP